MSSMSDIIHLEIGEVEFELPKSVFYTFVSINDICENFTFEVQHNGCTYTLESNCENEDEENDDSDDDSDEDSDDQNSKTCDTDTGYVSIFANEKEYLFEYFEFWDKIRSTASKVAKRNHKFKNFELDIPNLDVCIVSKRRKISLAMSSMEIKLEKEELVELLSLNTFVRPTKELISLLKLLF